jgi:hypothetical protein
MKEAAQAQNSTCLPSLLTAAGYVDIRRMACASLLKKKFGLNWKLSLMMPICSDLFHAFELASLLPCSYWRLRFVKAVYGRARVNDLMMTAA